MRAEVLHPDSPLSLAMIFIYVHPSLIEIRCTLPAAVSDDISAALWRRSPTEMTQALRCAPPWRLSRRNCSFMNR
jgi:hypothetical protein